MAWEPRWRATALSWSGARSTGAEGFIPGCAPGSPYATSSPTIRSATLNISCWKTPLPDTVLSWLRGAAAATEAKLRQRARHAGTVLAAAFADARVAPGTPLAVVDPAGNVVLANSEAAVLLGTPADTPAYAPTHRWTSQVPALRQLTLRVLERARQDPGWSGSTRVHVPFLGAPMSVAAVPSSTGPR